MLKLQPGTVLVFPAYVGMSPMSAEPAVRAASVPRIRGDEPQGKVKKLAVFACSPHTWG